MFRSIMEVLKRNRLKNGARKPLVSYGRFESLNLESCEDRLTPSGTPVFADGVVSGLVVAGGGTEGLSGVQVTLTGTTSTGRTVNISTSTDATGTFNFSQVLPGNYQVTRNTPTGYFSGSDATQYSVVVAESQVVNQNLSLAGLSPSRISMGLWSSGTTISIVPPTAGTGTATAFSIPTIQTLGTQTLTTGQTSYIDLAGFFQDPDVSNTTVNFNTSRGNIAVTLFDDQAPVTVTNFLNYIQAGAYTDDLFHRMANLGNGVAPSTPSQILQGGQYEVDSTGGNITGFSNVNTYQPIPNESNDTTRPNAINTLAMARTSVLNSATSQFYFNLTNNTTALAGSGGNGTGYAVFGAVTDATSQTNLASFANDYTSASVNIPTSSQPSNTLATVPVLDGVTPSGAFPIGSPVTDLATITGVTIPVAPTGDLSYTVSSSNTAVVTATLGTLNGSFSPDQLQLVAGGSPGTAVVTLTVTDNRGETVNYRFNVTVN